MAGKLNGTPAVLVVNMIHNGSFCSFFGRVAFQAEEDTMDFERGKLYRVNTWGSPVDQEWGDVELYGQICGGAPELGQHGLKVGFNFYSDTVEIDAMEKAVKLLKPVATAIDKICGEWGSYKTFGQMVLYFCKAVGIKKVYFTSTYLSDPHSATEYQNCSRLIDSCTLIDCEIGQKIRDWSGTRWQSNRNSL